jgi:hypothetical protein
VDTKAWLATAGPSKSSDHTESVFSILVGGKLKSARRHIFDFPSLVEYPSYVLILF